MGSLHIGRVADVINKYPDRFLFGTDKVAPADQQKYLKVYDMYAPFFAQLTPEASEKLRKGNYERLFNAAAAKVRAWGKANVQQQEILNQKIIEIFGEVIDSR